MRVERITVEVLRQDEKFTNDRTTLQVALDEGEDWNVVEPQLRDRATALIEGHWKRRREGARQLEEQRREAAAAEALQCYRDRNARAQVLIDTGKDPCEGCSSRHCGDIAGVGECPDNPGRLRRLATERAAEEAARDEKRAARDERARTFPGFKGSCGECPYIHDPGCSDCPGAELGDDDIPFDGVGGAS